MSTQGRAAAAWYAIRPMGQLHISNNLNLDTPDNPSSPSSPNSPGRPISPGGGEASQDKVMVVKGYVPSLGEESVLRVK